MIWPQVSLAQMAALLQPTYSVKIVDADRRADGLEGVRGRSSARERPAVLRDAAHRRRRCRTTCTARSWRRPSAQRTIAFGTHVTPMPTRDAAAVSRARLRPARRAGPDAARPHRSPRGAPVRPARVRRDALPKARSDVPAAPAATALTDGQPDLSAMRGLVWRRGQEVVVNPDRPFIADLDDLPMPLHHLLPLDKYRMPLLKGPFTFIVTSRGCPAGCTFCIKHVSYGPTLRMRSPAKLVEEIADPRQARRPQHPHVRRPVHGEPRPGGRACAGRSSTRA